MTRVGGGLRHNPNAPQKDLRGENIGLVHERVDKPQLGLAHARFGEAGDRPSKAIVKKIGMKGRDGVHKGKCSFVVGRRIRVGHVVALINGGGIYRTEWPFIRFHRRSRSGKGKKERAVQHSQPLWRGHLGKEHQRAFENGREGVCVLHG